MLVGLLVLTLSCAHDKVRQGLPYRLSPENYVGVYVASIPQDDGSVKDVVMTLKRDSTMVYHSVKRGHSFSVIDIESRFLVDEDVLIFAIPGELERAYMVKGNALVALDDNGKLVGSSGRRNTMTAYDFQLYSRELPVFPKVHKYVSGDGSCLLLFFMNDLYIDNYVRMQPGELPEVPLLFVEMNERYAKYANEAYTLQVSHDRRQVTLLGETGKMTAFLSEPVKKQ